MPENQPFSIVVLSYRLLFSPALTVLLSELSLAACVSTESLSSGRSTKADVRAGLLRRMLTR